MVDYTSSLICSFPVLFLDPAVYTATRCWRISGITVIKATKYPGFGSKTYNSQSCPTIAVSLPQGTLKSLELCAKITLLLAG